MRWPDGLLGLVLFRPAWPENQLTCRAWVVRQARWPREARRGGTTGHTGPCPIRPCLAWARAMPSRASPLLNFTYTSQDKILNTRQHYPAG